MSRADDIECEVGRSVPLCRMSARGSAGTLRPALHIRGSLPTAGYQPATQQVTNLRYQTAPVPQTGSLLYRRLAVGESSYRRSAFSLIEIMLAVALMTIIMLGLLAMFYQTQRAMRVGSAQVDVMGTGDAAIQLIGNELKQLTAAKEDGYVILNNGRGYVPNLEVRTPYPPLFWTRSFGSPQVTYLQELFFLRRENNDWIGTGYFVEPVTDKGGAGVLYRFESKVRATRDNALGIIYGEFQKARTTTVPRVADRIAHLQLTAYDAWGTNITFNSMTFTNQELPAYLDLELGVIEPKPYARFMARHDSNDVNTPFALAYLTNQLDRLHIFRHRIPVRTLQ